MLKKLKLSYYEKMANASENLGFLKRLFNSSRQGLFISIIFIGILVGLDFGVRLITNLLYSSSSNILNSCADILYKINDVIGIKFLDYFKDVIVIVAGILGVILGLFFTTFLNIVTSKYANINSAITYQMLKQKTINRYFKLLAILVSSAIIFQFLLVVGYNPTFISAFLFTISVIVSLLAFIFFGKHSLIYFNAGNLVFDLINSCDQILNRMHKNKKYFNTNNNGTQTLQKIAQNIGKIKLIVEESTKPQLTNTNSDSISDELLNFGIRYNSFKHTLPSDKDWHTKIQKYKSWDEASITEHEMYSKFGWLYPQTVDDFLYIEKLLIDIQFYIFRNLKSDSKIQLIYNQHKYLQVISLQCEVELFETFFNQLEQYVKDNLQKTGTNENKDNLQLISLYANLLVQYLVGFNHNFERIISEPRLRKLAKAIHNIDDTDSIMYFPYKIRIWADKYQQKLSNEKFYEGKILTPLFYTEYELSYQFQLLFKSSFEQIADNLHTRIILFSNYLKNQKLELEALTFLSDSLDVSNKIEFFSGIIENKIVNDIDSLNLRNEEKFTFSEREKLLERNKGFRKKAINEIWQVGWSSYTVQNKELPDIYGNFYQLICQDILDKAFENNGNELAKYLPQFYTYNLLYIESLRQKIDYKRLEFTASKLFPVIVDLFEISAITIIMFKAHNNKALENSFFDYWNNTWGKDASKERDFWKLILPIYEYYNQPLFGLSTPSYTREHNRKRRLEDYIKESGLVKLVEEIASKGFYYKERYYFTNCEDIHIRTIINHLRFNRNSLDIDLSEIFIEYYLRTRIVLKDLNIKETRYGKSLKRHLEENS